MKAGELLCTGKVCLQEAPCKCLHLQIKLFAFEEVECSNYRQKRFRDFIKISFDLFEYCFVVLKSNNRNKEKRLEK